MNKNKHLTEQIMKRKGKIFKFRDESAAQWQIQLEELMQMELR